MSKALQATLRDEITIKILEHNKFPIFRLDYENGNFPRADRVQDLNKRFRWDIFWLINKETPTRPRAFRDEIESENLNDDHIDTFLKSVIPLINRNY